MTEATGAGFGMDAPTIAAISSFVTLICGCVVAANGGTLRGWIALAIAGGVAAIGTLAWAFSQGRPVDLTWLWGLLSGWGLAMGAGLGALLGINLLGGGGLNLNRQTELASLTQALAAYRAQFGDLQELPEPKPEDAP